MNWWAKLCSPAVSIICITILITSCKKEGDFNLGSAPNAGVGIVFTDTVTLQNSTFLLNDSLISAKPTFLSFGGYSDPSATGNTYAEAYSALSLGIANIDYTGVTIDSAKLKVYYEYAYGDTLAGQDFAVHEITTQMDVSVPYQTTTNFVTYDPTVGGSVTGVQTRPGSKSTLSIPLTNAFATTILNAADDRSDADFKSNFYGVVIKSLNNSAASIIRGNYTNSNDIGTRVVVYFKRGSKQETAVFYLVQYSASFNRVLTDRAGTQISSLATSGDNIPAAATNNKCYIQAGTGVVTKVTMPNLLNLATVDGSSVIVNKAILILPIDASSDLGKYAQVVETGLLELNPDNSYKYRNGALAYVQSSTPNSLGYYTNVTSSATSTAETSYRFDITRYVQLLLNGKYPNDGFIINPYQNSFYANRTVLNSSNASDRKMRIEIYYTKVK